MSNGEDLVGPGGALMVRILKAEGRGISGRKLEELGAITGLSIVMSQDFLGIHVLGSLARNRLEKDEKSEQGAKSFQGTSNQSEGPF
jgi:hypothetical protein